MVKIPHKSPKTKHLLPSHPIVATIFHSHNILWKSCGKSLDKLLEAGLLLQPLVEKSPAVSCRLEHLKSIQISSSKVVFPDVKILLNENVCLG